MPGVNQPSVCDKKCDCGQDHGKRGPRRISVEGPSRPAATRRSVGRDRHPLVESFGDDPWLGATLVKVRTSNVERRTKAED